MILSVRSDLKIKNTGRQSVDVGTQNYLVRFPGEYEDPETDKRDK